MKSASGKIDFLTREVELRAGTISELHEQLVDRMNAPPSGENPEYSVSTKAVSEHTAVLAK